MALADKITNKGILNPKNTDPVWSGPAGEGENGGITYSLLSRYLVCKERFRLLVMEGLKAKEAFNSRMEFGNMWHCCEEALSAGKSWETALDGYATELSHKYPMSREEIKHFAEVCYVEYEGYKEHWKAHSTKNVIPIFQEKAFDVKYPLPSGRVVRLRGKLDSVFYVKSGECKGVWLQENKTKSRIEPDKVVSQLSFDLQTMLYVTAANCLLVEDTTASGTPKPNGFNLRKTLRGVLYNVVRRSAHKSVDSLVKKLEEDRNKGRMREWYDRWNVNIFLSDVCIFAVQCLHPVLENLCEDYEWWSWCFYKNRSGMGGNSIWDYELRHKQFPQHVPRHYRYPYGVYNPFLENANSDLDHYLETGSEVGLKKVSDLFPELPK